MYKIIVNPITNNKVRTQSLAGKKIIENFIKYLDQKGGAAASQVEIIDDHDPSSMLIRLFADVPYGHPPIVTVFQSMWLEFISIYIPETDDFGVIQSWSLHKASFMNILKKMTHAQLLRVETIVHNMFPLPHP